jgi:branched-chain amino acid aminotransferase
MTSSWQRNDHRAVPTAAKATAHYLNSAITKAEALDAGFDEALLLNASGYVSECTGANVFVVRDGRLATPPPHAGALAGITQDTIATLAADLGLEVDRQDLLRTDLYTADEVFVCGTAVGIAHVASVDHCELGGPGPVTGKLADAYENAVHGRDDRYRRWLSPITRSPAP